MINTSHSADLREKGGNVLYIAFWGHDGNNGWLSQWYPSPFTFTLNAVHKTLLQNLAHILSTHSISINLDLISGKEFLTAEHFMMTGKALLFDTNSLHDIISAQNPKQVKAAGRNVKNFNQDIWDKVNVIWVTIGNYLKFTQHDNLKKLLTGTGTKVLIEASPLDKIWGVGLAPTSHLLKTPKNWKGENRLGDALMTVRQLT